MSKGSDLVFTDDEPIEIGLELDTTAADDKLTEISDELIETGKLLDALYHLDPPPENLDALVNRLLDKQIRLGKQHDNLTYLEEEFEEREYNWG